MPENSGKTFTWMSTQHEQTTATNDVTPHDATRHDGPVTGAHLREETAEDDRHEEDGEHAEQRLGALHLHVVILAAVTKRCVVEHRRQTQDAALDAVLAQRVLRDLDVLVQHTHACACACRIRIQLCSNAVHCTMHTGATDST